MNFIPGDFVKFLDEKGEGIITKLISKKLVMIDIGGGLEVQAEASELILIYRHIKEEPMTAHTTPNSVPETKQEVKTKEKKTSFIENPKPYKTIREQRQYKSGIDVQAHAESLSTAVFDLHIEKLTKSFSHLSNGEIMQIQLRKFDQIINDALLGKYRRIVLIHGIGEGTLRREMHARLKEYESFTYFDADERKFGYGATEVVLK